MIILSARRGRFLLQKSTRNLYVITGMVDETLNKIMWQKLFELLLEDESPSNK